jgi:hypothetical protein
MRSPLELVDVPSGIPWKSKGRAKPGQPTRIVATWSDAVLNRPGQPAQRGFGGKIFFYGRDDAKPIEVEGQVVIYAFEEDSRLPTDRAPNKRYVFPPEQLALHKSEDEIGPAYSFWLPWDEAGGHQLDVSLMTRFEPLGGGEMIVSDSARQRLPGRLNPETMIAKTPPSESSIKPVSYNEASSQPKAASRRLETHNIALPEKRR